MTDLTSRTELSAGTVPLGIRTPFTQFGETRMVRVETYLNRKPTESPQPWGQTLWVERPEDWYALDAMRDSVVLVVTRENWRSSHA